MRKIAPEAIAQPSECNTGILAPNSAHLKWNVIGCQSILNVLSHCINLYLDFLLKRENRNVSVKHLPSVHVRVCVGLWSNSINKWALFNLFSECTASQSPPFDEHIKDKAEKDSHSCSQRLGSAWVEPGFNWHVKRQNVSAPTGLPKALFLGAPLLKPWGHSLGSLSINFSSLTDPAPQNPVLNLNPKQLALQVLCRGLQDPVSMVCGMFFCKRKAVCIFPDAW